MIYVRMVIDIHYAKEFSMIELGRSGLFEGS